MEILNFDGATPSRKKRGNRALLAVGAILVAVVGSTYAANISINNAPVEYGQGVAQTTACDSSIYVAPTNTFINASQNGNFYLYSVAVYDSTTTSSSTGLGKCLGKAIKVTAYGDSANTILFQCDVSLGSTYSSGFSPTFYNSASNCGTPGSNGTDTVAGSGGGGVSNDGFTITIPSVESVTASSIYKITVESHV